MSQNFQRQTNPITNSQFRRRWQPSTPTLPRERRLAELRALHGPMEGGRLFIQEQKAGLWSAG